MVKYKYNAWVTATQVITQGCEELDVLYNPFKFKGYFYDGETGFYYLKARYYAPIIGKFISMDSIDYMHIKSLNGVNLYAYCNNNPIMYADPSGHIPIGAILFALLCTPIGGIALQLAVSTVAYAGMLVASLFDDDIKQDLKNIKYNPFNSSESQVLASNKVSFYKGVPVFRTNMERSFSFGAIFLRRMGYDDKGVYCVLNDPDEVRHERGHNWQLMMMGLGIYGFTVCIPSPLNLGPWSKKGRYYYAPWETFADILGGINQRYGNPIPQQQIKNAWVYYAMGTIFFPLTVFYWI